MSIEIHNMEQRSPEWFAIRKGRIGGSEADGLLTPAKMKTLLYKKAAEILYDTIEEESYVSAVMQRGIDLEPDALYEYFLETEVLPMNYGYITNESKYCGLSPDGVNKAMTVAQEVKCLSRYKHVEIIDSNTIPKEYHAQLSWYHFVIPTLERVDFISYDPDAPRRIHIIPFYRKEAIDFTDKYELYINELNKILKKCQSQEN